MANFVTDVFLVTGRDSDLSIFILDTTTQGQEGNLFDVSWRNKAKRYVGFKRNPDDEYVVTDIVVITEYADVPDDYASCLITKDTREKGLRKHILCYKRDLRSSSPSGITEIHIIAKGEQMPAQFTCIPSTLNENQIIFKSEPIAPRRPTRPAPTLPAAKTAEVPLASPGSPVCGLDGVPFQINPKYSASSASDPFVQNIRILTLEDVLSGYNYTFDLERSIID